MSGRKRSILRILLGGNSRTQRASGRKRSKPTPQRKMAAARRKSGWF